MIDVENTRFGADPTGVPYKGEAARTYYFPRCNTATEHDGYGTETTFDDHAARVTIRLRGDTVELVP
jgi:hypothetical protein